MSEQNLFRRAEWIERPRQLDGLAFATEGRRVGEEANRSVYFRLTISVRGTVTLANCLASGDALPSPCQRRPCQSRPGRCRPLLQSLDGCDVAGYLKPGRHVIAALAHACGVTASFR